MAVITVSRQIGSGGEEIANRLCEVLGYQQFDKRLIVQAAAESGLTEQEAIDYSEENHKVGSFIDRLFNRTTTVLHARVWKEDPSGARISEEVKLSEEAVVALVEHAIRSAGRMGNMIIIGRAGQVILKDLPDALHIRIEAPMETRIQKIKDQFRSTRRAFHADIDLRRESQDWINQRDLASADYLKRFYGVDWADPLHYHLVINTGRVSIEQAVEIITSLVKAFTPNQIVEEISEVKAHR
jgi:CMP/dCMP kinase